MQGIHRKERENRKRKTLLTHTGLLMEGVSRAASQFTRHGRRATPFQQHFSTVLPAFPAPRTVRRFPFLARSAPSERKGSFSSSEKPHSKELATADGREEKTGM